MAAPPALRLYALSVSPWSERARWVLQHHGLAFQKVDHIPLLGERRLRKLLGNPAGRVTVPVLIADGQTLADSWEIALYADRVGQGSKLLPEELTADVRRWHDLAERSMSAGRALTMASLLGNDAALEEMLPPATPRLARRWLRPIARRVARSFVTKYGLDLQNTSQSQAIQREGLDALRTALVRSEYVLGRFSYADIIAASLLQGVLPVAQRYLRLGPATRDAWTRPDLAAAYSDLVSWRDRLYERHRHSGATAAGAAAPRLDSVT